MIPLVAFALVCSSATPSLAVPPGDDGSAQLRRSFSEDIPTNPKPRRGLEILEQFSLFLTRASEKIDQARAEELRVQLFKSITQISERWASKKILDPAYHSYYQRTVREIRAFQGFREYTQHRVEEKKVDETKVVKTRPDTSKDVAKKNSELTRVFKQKVTVDYFTTPIELLQKEGIVPKDFIPTQENKGVFGPESRTAAISYDERGPWDFQTDGRKLWWLCYVHGINKAGSFVGTVRVYFNISTGEMIRPEYSPKGNIAWFKPSWSSVLYKDLHTAARQSTHASRDINIYRSLMESGYVPQSYVKDPRSYITGAFDDREGGFAFTKRPGDERKSWRKVIEIGSVGAQKVAVHYFMHELTGEVTRVNFYPFRIGRPGTHKVAITFGTSGGTILRLRTDLLRDDVKASPDKAQEVVDSLKATKAALKKDVIKTQGALVRHTTKEHFTPTDYKAPTPRKKSASSSDTGRITPDIKKRIVLLVPQLMTPAYQERARLLLELANSYMKLHEKMDDVYAKKSSAAKKQALVLYGQTGQTLFSPHGNLAERYMKSIADEKEWTEVIEQSVEAVPTFAESEECRETLREIRTLQEERVSILDQFHRNLEVMSEAELQTKGTIRFIITGVSQKSAAQVTLISSLYKDYVVAHNEANSEKSTWTLTDQSSKLHPNQHVLVISGPGVVKLFSHEGGVHRLYLRIGSRKFQPTITVRVFRQNPDRTYTEISKPGNDGSFVRTYHELEGHVQDERDPHNQRFSYQDFLKGKLMTMGVLLRRLFFTEYVTTHLKTLRSDLDAMVVNLEAMEDIEAVTKSLLKSQKKGDAVTKKDSTSALFDEVSRNLKETLDRTGEPANKKKKGKRRGRKRGK